MMARLGRLGAWAQRDRIERAGFGLQWLMARVLVAPQAHGCLVWAGTLAQGGVKACLGDGAGGSISFNVRKMVWECAQGKTLRRRWRAACMHGVAGCVHPDHLVACSESSAMSARPVAQRTKRALTQAAYKRSPLTLAQVKQMRSESGTYTSQAARYGVSVATVSAIMRGVRWCDAQAGYVGTVWAAMP
jgi:DNA-binding transcriptional regulator YiaG